MTQHEIDAKLAAKAAQRSANVLPMRGAQSAPIAAKQQITLPTSPSHRMVFLALLTMSTEGKTEGYIDRKGQQAYSAVVSHKSLLTKLRMENLSAELDAPLGEIMDDLAEVELIRIISSPTKGKLYIPKIYDEQAPTVRGARSARGTRQSDFRRTMDTLLQSVEFTGAAAPLAATGTDGGKK